MGRQRRRNRPRRTDRIDITSWFEQQIVVGCGLSTDQQLTDDSTPPLLSASDALEGDALIASSSTSSFDDNDSETFVEIDAAAELALDFHQRATDAAQVSKSGRRALRARAIADRKMPRIGVHELNEANFLNHNLDIEDALQGAIDTLNDAVDVARLRTPRAGNRTVGQALNAFRKEFWTVYEDHVNSFLAPSYWGSYAWGELKPVDINLEVVERFLANLERKKNARLVLGFHCTKRRNYNSILSHGFVLPGKHGVTVANGQALGGLGVYQSRTPQYTFAYSDYGEVFVSAVIDTTPDRRVYSGMPNYGRTHTHTPAPKRPRQSKDTRSVFGRRNFKSTSKFDPTAPRTGRSSGTHKAVVTATSFSGSGSGSGGDDAAGDGYDDDDEFEGSNGGRRRQHRKPARAREPSFNIEGIASKVTGKTARNGQSAHSGNIMAIYDDRDVLPLFSLGFTRKAHPSANQFKWSYQTVTSAYRLPRVGDMIPSDFRRVLVAKARKQLRLRADKRQTRRRAAARVAKGVYWKVADAAGIAQTVASPPVGVVAAAEASMVAFVPAPVPTASAWDTPAWFTPLSAVVPAADATIVAKPRRPSHDKAIRVAIGLSVVVDRDQLSAMMARVGAGEAGKGGCRDEMATAAAAAAAAATAPLSPTPPVTPTAA